LHHPTTQLLLAVGFCLIMAGLFLRGFAASTRRDLARRRQHQRAERKSTDTTLAAELARPPGWFEKNLGLVANLVLLTGLALVTAALLR
jgi:hypothetical protein